MLVYYRTGETSRNELDKEPIDYKLSIITKEEIPYFQRFSSFLSYFNCYGPGDKGLIALEQTTRFVGGYDYASTSCLFVARTNGV